MASRSRKDLQYCEQCIYCALEKLSCDYYLITDQRRGCEPGYGCEKRVTVQEARRRRREAMRVTPTVRHRRRPACPKQTGTPRKQNPKPSKYDWTRAEELLNQGMSLADIARALGCSKNTVGSWMKRSGKHSTLPRGAQPPSAEADALRRRLWASGASDVEIGEAAGISKTTVFEWRRKNGLPANLKPGQHRKAKKGEEP